MLTKRQRTWFQNSPYYKRRPRINLIRPAGYRTSQSWQDWRAMKYIARNPMPPAPFRNIRTGGYLGKELKFVDNTYQSAVAVNWTLEMPATGSFNAVAVGAGESERIGRKISNSSLHIRGNLILSGATPALSSRCRIVLVKDNQTNGAALVPGNVIVGGIDGFRNLEHVSRFQILFDRTYTLTPAITYDGSMIITNQPRRSFTINVKTSGDTLYDGPTAGISDITDCSYQLIAISDYLAITIDYQSRFRYRG